MNLSSVFNYCRNELIEEHQEGEAIAISKNLLAFHLNMEPSFLSIKGDISVNELDFEKIKLSLNKLKQHIPLQYITGEAWFYNQKFKVTNAVLIPRPETEELVALCLSKCAQNNITILDIGTGSGCIPIILDMHLVNANVYSTDISKAALLIAKENNEYHKTNVHFIEANFLDEDSWASLPKANIIMSNPPYIPLLHKEKMMPQVRDHEPAIALFVADKNPLIFYEKIEKFARANLLPGGTIFLETHHDNADEVLALFQNNYHTAMKQQDMSGNDRMIVATLCR